MDRFYFVDDDINDFLEIDEIKNEFVTAKNPANALAFMSKVLTFGISGRDQDVELDENMDTSGDNDDKWFDCSSFFNGLRKENKDSPELKEMFSCCQNKNAKLLKILITKHSSKYNFNKKSDFAPVQSFLFGAYTKMLSEVLLVQKEAKVRGPSEVLKKRHAPNR